MTTMPALDKEEMNYRLAELILSGKEFTSDDLTNRGADALDNAHGRYSQGGIGALFNTAQTRRHIEWTGEVTKSRSPYRHSGTIRIWRGTPRGRTWARTLRGEQW